MITVFCVNCDKETESVYKYCKHCGDRLPDVSITNWIAAFILLVAFGGLAWLAWAL